MAATSSVPLVFLLVTLMALGGIAGLFWRLWAIKPRAIDPTCGKCGYCVRGLPSMTCPECGSDLREVGIVTPAQRRGWGPVPWIVLWTALLPWPAVMISAVVMTAIGPCIYSQQLRRVIFCQSSHLDATVTLIMESHRLGWGGPPTGPIASTPWQAMQLQRNLTNGQSTSMQVDPVSKACVWTDAAGRPVNLQVPFGQEALLQWFSATGADRTDPIMQARVADILTTVNEAPTAVGKYTRLGQSPGDSGITAHPSSIWATYRPAPWSIAAVGAIWVLIWIVGVLLILRQHRRTRSQSAAQPAGSAEAATPEAQ